MGEGPNSGRLGTSGRRALRRLRRFGAAIALGAAAGEGAHLLFGGWIAPSIACIAVYHFAARPIVEFLIRGAFWSSDDRVSSDAPSALRLLDERLRYARIVLETLSRRQRERTQATDGLSSDIEDVAADAANSGFASEAGALIDRRAPYIDDVPDIVEAWRQVIAAARQGAHQPAGGPS